MTIPNPIVFLIDVDNTLLDNDRIQAAVVSKMLEQAGFTVGLQILDATVYNRKTFLSDVD